MEKKKSRKKLFITLGIVGGALMTTLVVLYAAFVISTIHTLRESARPYHEMEDTNGPADTSLALITQEELIAGNLGGYAYKSAYFGHGESTKVTGKFADVDYERRSCRWGKTSGAWTIHSSKIENGTLILDITSELTTGNAEIIILVDGQYHSHVPVGGKQTVMLEDVAGKTVLVRVGCEAAQMEITVERRIEE
jgi:hypothetical protein